MEVAGRRRMHAVFGGLTTALLAVTVCAQDLRDRPDRAEETPTLATAVGEALVRNDRMINGRDSIEQARLGVRLASNAFDLKVVPNVAGSFGQTNVSNQTYRLDLSRKLTTGTEVRAGVGASTSQIPGASGQPDIRFYNTDTTVAVSQPLLRGFGPSVARRGQTTAELRQGDAARQFARDEQLLAIEVADAYYAVVAQQNLLGVSTAGLDRSRKLVESSQAKKDAGLVSQLDVLRARDLLSAAELQLADVEAAGEDARDQLRLLMGRDSDAPFTVVAEFPRVADTGTTEDLVALALEKRSDYQTAVAAASDGMRAVAFSRNQLLPQVDANLAMTRRETAPSFSSSFGLDRFKFATFFTISMPVDRTPQLIDYQNTLIDRDRRQRNVDMMRRMITDDVKRAVRERDRMKRTVVAADAAVDIARQEVDVAQERYARGLSNNLDLVAAEGNLLSAESRRITALANAAVARLRLRATVGILDPRRDLVDADTLPADGSRHPGAR